LNMFPPARLKSFVVSHEHDEIVGVMLMDRFQRKKLFELRGLFWCVLVTIEPECHFARNICDTYLIRRNKTPAIVGDVKRISNESIQPSTSLQHPVYGTITFNLARQGWYKAGLRHYGEKLFLVLFESRVAIDATGYCPEIWRIRFLKQATRNDMVVGRRFPRAVDAFQVVHVTSNQYSLHFIKADLVVAPVI